MTASTPTGICTSVTPKVQRGQARESLLSAGAELFYAQGIHAVSVDAVAEHTGVTKRTVYQHFSGKDALVAAALETRGQAWRAWFDAELARRGKTPASQLLAMFDVIAEESAVSGYRGCRFANAAAELSRPHAPGPPGCLGAQSRRARSDHQPGRAAGCRGPSPARQTAQGSLGGRDRDGPRRPGRATGEGRPQRGSHLARGRPFGEGPAKPEERNAERWTSSSKRR